MRRRDFLSLVGGTAAWPLAARAQRATMPVIGFLSAAAPDALQEWLQALRRGLKESGYTEGENIAIEYRWSESNPGRLAELAADLVRRKVKVVVALSAPASIAAVKATT